MSTATPPASPPARDVSSAVGRSMSPATPNRWWQALVVVAVMTLIALGAARLLPDPVPSHGLRSIAVLPLRPLGDSTLERNADAIAEEIMTRLAMDTTLTVRMVPRSQGRAPQGMDVTELGKQLGTAYVADGGVPRGSDRIRVTLRLVRTSDAVAVWAGSADIQTADLPGGAQRLASELAAAIATRLR